MWGLGLRGFIEGLFDGAPIEPGGPVRIAGQSRGVVEGIWF